MARFPPVYAHAFLATADNASVNISSPGIARIDISSPGIARVDIYSPGIASVNISSPGFASVHISSPGFASVDISSPGFASADISSPLVSFGPSLSIGNKTHLCTDAGMEQMLRWHTDVPDSIPTLSGSRILIFNTV